MGRILNASILIFASCLIGSVLVYFLIGWSAATAVGFLAIYLFMSWQVLSYANAINRTTLLFAGGFVILLGFALGYILFNMARWLVK